MLGKKLIENYRNANKAAVLMTCREIKQRYAENPNHEDNVKDFYNMGCIYMDYGDYENAVEVLSAALANSIALAALTENNSYRILNYKISNNLAICYYKRYGLDKTRMKYVFKYLQNALEYAQSAFSADSEQYITALYNMGVMYYETGSYEIALQYFYQLEKYKNVKSHINNLNYIGYCLEKTGEYERAAMFLRQSLSELEGSSDIGEYTSNLYYLAKVYIKAENYSDAFSAVSEVMDILDSNGCGKTAMYIDVLVTLMKIHIAENDYKKALSITGRALIIAEQITLSSKNKSVLFDIAADIYMKTEYYEKAVDILEKLYRVNERINPEALYDNCIRILEAALKADKRTGIVQYIEKLFNCPQEPTDRYLRSIYCLVKLYTSYGEADEVANLYENYVLPVNPDMSYEELIRLCISDDEYSVHNYDEFEPEKAHTNVYDGLDINANQFDEIMGRFGLLSNGMPDLSSLEEGEVPDIDTFREKVCRFLEALRMFREKQSDSEMAEVIKIVEQNFIKNSEYMENNERTRLMISNMIDKFLDDFDKFS